MSNLCPRVKERKGTIDDHRKPQSHQRQEGVSTWLIFSLPFPFIRIALTFLDTLRGLDGMSSFILTTQSSLRPAGYGYSWPWISQREYRERIRLVTTNPVEKEHYFAQKHFLSLPLHSDSQSAVLI